LRNLGLSTVLATLAILALGSTVASARPVRPLPVYDRFSGTGACRVSSDGAMWYLVPAAAFSPLEVARSDCPGGRFAIVPAPVPSWAIPQGPTQAIFSAVSLVEYPRDHPIEPIRDLAHAAGIPLTFLIDGPWIADNAPIIDAAHAMYGDDAQVYPVDDAAARAAWPWFHPTVAVLGAGWERGIDAALKDGDRAFWGITWNSAGVDFTADRGAPWGAYCADPASYKRPSPNDDCGFMGIEWTARDLTMAYESEHEDAYSTDPDDLRLRAHLDTADAGEYERRMIDAYAAAGQTTPILVVSQEEAWEFATNAAADTPIMSALYDQAKRDGMTITTLPDAVERLAASAGRPRVIAFPSLAASGRYGPATIDAHDAHTAMTFRAAQLLPARVFAYDRETRSSFNAPVPELTPAEMPTLTDVRASAGVLTLRLHAPIATDFGVAFWTDPAAAGWTSPNVVPAGRAGAVAFFNLAAGDNVVTLGCRICTSTTFPYAGG
jgi:hypothetical protein